MHLAIFFKCGCDVMLKKYSKAQFTRPKFSLSKVQAENLLNVQCQFYCFHQNLLVNNCLQINVKTDCVVREL